MESKTEWLEQRPERNLPREMGARIGALRRERGWSQADLAERLGVTRERLRKWEAGRNAPPLEGLISLSRALGTSYEELLTGQKPGPQPLGLNPEQRVELAQHLAGIARLLEQVGFSRSTEGV